MKDQINFKSDLGGIRKRKSKLKSKDQISVIQNVHFFFFFFFELTEKSYWLFRDYFLSLSEANYKEKYWKVLKMLTPKQMLQTLPIALAEVKPGNTFENLLNEIR